MSRILFAALLGSCTLACTPTDLSTSNVPSCPADIPSATTANPAGFTIHAPKPLGWSTQPVEEGGLVLHRFETIEGADPPFGTATVTVATFSPAKTADAATSILQILPAANLTGTEHVPKKCRSAATPPTSPPEPPPTPTTTT
ncbi:hypothetical protein [Nocardia fluminea]|uniref:hypothetical protein n=1 Tax=Nocardia fluminea TaxID=134984 RepID=UPI003D14BCDC